MTSGNYKLSYRRGYYADKPRSDANSAEEADDPLIPLIGLGMPNFDQILYKVRLSPKNPQPTPNAPRAGSNTELKPPFTRYDVEFAVSLKDIAMGLPSEAVRHGHIEVMLIAFDHDGKILNILKRRSKLAMDTRSTPQHKPSACKSTKRSILLQATSISAQVFTTSIPGTAAPSAFPWSAYRGKRTEVTAFVGPPPRLVENVSPLQSP